MEVEQKRTDEAVVAMEMGDKLVYAAAFAGAFAAELRHRQDDVGGDEESLRAWQQAAAVAAARQALGAVIGLKLAEVALEAKVEAEGATLEAQREALRREQAVSEVMEAVLLRQMITAFRAGFEGEGEDEVDCPYACDGQCGGHAECMTCEYGGEDEDEDDEDEDDEEEEEVAVTEALSPEEQAIVADAERTVGTALRFARTAGPPGHACECETCEQPCAHREEILRAVAMLNKVRSGQHDA